MTTLDQRLEQIEARLNAAKNETFSESLAASMFNVDSKRDVLNSSVLTDGTFLLASLRKAVEAMQSSVTRADDYGDSWCSRPIRDALNDLSKMAGEM